MDLDPRVIFAAQRTLLAWIRTGLAMMGFGFVVARFSLFLREIAHLNPNFPKMPGVSLYFGVVLIILGVLATFNASYQFRRDMKNLLAGKSLLDNKRWDAGEVFGIVLGLLGAAMVFYLLQIQQ